MNNFIAWWAVLACATAAVLASVSPVPATAGVMNGRQVVDSTIVYLGIVPAVFTRNHPGDVEGTLMHGGTRDKSIHNVHVIVALFDRATGARIANSRVLVRFLGERGRKWSVRPQPMVVNGALTYGAYTSRRCSSTYGKWWPASRARSRPDSNMSTTDRHVSAT